VGICPKGSVKGQSTNLGITQNKTRIFNFDRKPLRRNWLMSDRAAGSAIPASSRWMKNGCVSWALPQISNASGAMRFAFIPLER
jgi:hypothetical protein